MEEITMQSEGVYRYPNGWICLLLSLLAVVSTASVWLWKSLCFTEVLSLFLSLEGTVLLASAFSPIGLTPPQGNLFKKIHWFFKQQGGVPVSYNQPMFYGGLLFLFVASTITAFNY